MIGLLQKKLIYIYFLGLIGGYFAPQTFVILEKPGCAICEYVINDLQTIIGSNRSEAQIEAGLEKVCEEMKKSGEYLMYFLSKRFLKHNTTYI